MTSLVARKEADKLNFVKRMVLIYVTCRPIEMSKVTFPSLANYPHPSPLPIPRERGFASLVLPASTPSPQKWGEGWGEGLSLDTGVGISRRNRGRDQPVDNKLQGLGPAAALIADLPIEFELGMRARAFLK
jgi:hypothetical protein